MKAEAEAIEPKCNRKKKTLEESLASTRDIANRPHKEEVRSESHRKPPDEYLIPTKKRCDAKYQDQRQEGSEQDYTTQARYLSSVIKAISQTYKRREQS